MTEIVSPSNFSLALAQLNPTVGDIAGNFRLARDAYEEAVRQSADIVLYSELFVSGYPPEDLVLKPSFLDSVERIVDSYAALTADGGAAMIVGSPWRGRAGRIYNAVLCLDGGEIVAIRYKSVLPNYLTFDEKRLFSSGEAIEPVCLRGIRIGLPICEDIWVSHICTDLKEAGAEILLVANGSPWDLGKVAKRYDVVSLRVRETGLPLVYLNQFGGQDELVFDGRSFILSASGAVAHSLTAWESAVAVSHWHRSVRGVWDCDRALLHRRDSDVCVSDAEEIYCAALCGLRDYVDKNGFSGVLLGLSGGIDSALCAALACDALGADRVRSFMLPFVYTADETIDDAAQCAQNLGITHDILPIHDAVGAVHGVLHAVLPQSDSGVTGENIQSRIRGVLLMALSNQTGRMLLSTGNKSEIAVGYSTLYGDMNGGFNPLKDLYKTQVFMLARWRNGHCPKMGLGVKGVVIPERILTKPPSAELRPDQKDCDSLPDYDVLDAILERLVEKDMSAADIHAEGYDLDVVLFVERLLYLAEYKRRQSPPGVRIGERNFQRDRRYPITNGFHGTGSKGGKVGMSSPDTVGIGDKKT